MSILSQVNRAFDGEEMEIGVTVEAEDLMVMASCSAVDCVFRRACLRFGHLNVLLLLVYNVD